MSQVEISRRLVAINALSAVLARVINVGALLWVNQYLLQRLSPEEYAPLPVVTAFYLFMEVFTAFLSGGIARYATEAYARNDLRRVTEIVSSMLPLIGAAVLVFWSIGALASWAMDFLLTIEPDQMTTSRLMLVLMVFGHGVVLLTLPFSVGLHIRQKFVWLNLVKLGEQTFRLILLFIFLFGVSTSVHWVVVSAQIALLVGVSATVVISRRLVPALRFEPDACRRSVMKELAAFGGWTMLGNLLYRIRTSADVLILNKLSTPLDVTAFYVGRIPDRQMDGFVSVASITLQPALTAMHATNRHDSLRNAYLRGNRYYLWMALAVAVPLFVYSRELAVLYAGETYALAGVVLAFTCAIYPFNYASEMLYQICMAKARIREFFLIVSAASAVQIAATVTLVGYFQLGVFGVVYSSTALTVFTQLAFLWPLGLRLLDLEFGRYLRETLIPGYIPAAGALACGFAFKTALPASTWFSAGLGVFFCLAVYGCLMVVASRAEDRRDMAKAAEHFGSKIAALRRGAASPPPGPSA